MILVINKVDALAFAGVAPALPGMREVPMGIPELMTVAEFCERYRIGRTSAYREAASGRLKMHKFGAATRIRRADAEEWMRALPEKGEEAA